MNGNPTHDRHVYRQLIYFMRYKYNTYFNYKILMFSIPIIP